MKQQHSLYLGLAILASPLLSVNSLVTLSQSSSAAGGAVNKEQGHGKNEECNPRDWNCFGPSQATLDCQNSFIDQEKLHFRWDQKPEAHYRYQIKTDFERTQSKASKDLPGIISYRLQDSDYFEKWYCGKQEENGCYDDQKGERGEAILFVPDKAKKEKETSRILYIHGGSWEYGSPDSYFVYCSELSRDSGMSVLAIDYTLAPVGHFKKILHQVGRGASWLATHDVLNYENDKGLKSKQLGYIYIMGDSSGGGSALSAIVAQASENGLPGSDGFKLHGGVLLSPWINLISNSPTYFSQAFASSNPAHILVGDIAFTYKDPVKYVKSAYDNAKEYIGDLPLHHPIANPFYASKQTLSNMVPISLYVGLPELLQSDITIFGSRAASSGASVEVHLYDGMWHVFPEYNDGCGDNMTDVITLAKHSYFESIEFIKNLSENNNSPKVPRGLGFPKTVVHYEFPKRHDSSVYWTFDDDDE